MIVSDTNLIAYLFLGGTHTDAARDVLLRDPQWAAPMLWRSEFRNIIAGYLRRGEIRVQDAWAVATRAEQLLAGREHIVESADVLQLVARSRCSAYDCEFVALAARLRVPLVTSDRAILRDFPSIAVAPARYLSGRAVEGS